MAANTVATLPLADITNSNTLPDLITRVAEVVYILNNGLAGSGGNTEHSNTANTALTANNALHAFGKLEADLNVNSAVTALTANNALHAFGKLEADLNVNSAVTALTANNATFAFGKTEINLNVNSALFANSSLFANNADFLGGQPNTYYTNASNLATGTVPTARLGSGVANSTTFLAGDSTWQSVAGASVPVANTTVNGTVSTTTQSFAGVKTFTANVATNGNFLIAKARPELQLITDSGDTRMGRVTKISDVEMFVTHNLSHNGSAWLFDDVSANGTLFGIPDPASGERFQLWQAPASANPATLSRIFAIDILGGIYEHSRLLGAGEWENWTPIWTAASVNPTNGALAGRRMTIGKSCFFTLIWNANSSTTFGTGIWSFSTPYTANASTPLVAVSVMRPAATNFRLAVGRFQTNTTFSLLYDTGTNFISSSAPATWTNGDSIFVFGCMEKAAF